MRDWLRLEGSSGGHLIQCPYTDTHESKSEKSAKEKELFGRERENPILLMEWNY